MEKLISLYGSCKLVANTIFGSIIHWIKNTFRRSIPIPNTDEIIVITTFDHFQRSSKISYLHGKKHSVSGPSEIIYYPSGNKKYEFYYTNGLLNRQNKPAYIKYSENGQIINKYFYSMGKRVIPSNG